MPSPSPTLKENLGLHILDSLQEGCQVIGFDYTYIYANDAVATHGRKTVAELLGRKMSDCYPGIEKTGMFEVLKRSMEARTQERLENEFTFPDGSSGWFDLRFIPVPEGVCILSWDITTSRHAAATSARIDEQLQQSQRMEALGRLASGVAHDFNNLLSVILAYSGMLHDELRSNDPMRESLAEIMVAGDKASELTRQLLAFGRYRAVEPHVVDLNRIVMSMSQMIGRVVGAEIDVRATPSLDVGKVKVDPGQIEQVLLNLALNARDAMPKGGTLLIATETVELDASEAALHPGVKAGHHVVLSVSDNGIGIDAKTQARMFEPFFTTKENGTGLGLATVLGIVRAAGGHIRVQSEPKKGATFKVYFPSTDEALTPVAQRPLSSAARGVETVLLVEDENQLRPVAAAILRRHGYRVLEARNGGEALIHCEKHPGHIHLLLTDVAMPLMNGGELVERLLPMRPEMKVLYTTGHTDNATVHRHIATMGIRLLQKPITPDSLLRSVRETLEKR